MMLSSEEATIRLEAIANPRWREDAAIRIAGLPLPMQAPASQFTEEEPVGASWHQQRTFYERLGAAASTLDELSDTERLVLCEALHPNLGPAIAKWWVDAQAQPYSISASRRAFRAPRRPEITRPVRSRQLLSMIARLGEFEGDAEWLASWAPYVARSGRRRDSGFAAAVAGPLLASAIDLGGSSGESVYRRLLDVAEGEDTIGVMGRHVIVAFLRCGRSDAWEYIEHLLLSAQRQEGLRQSILEAVDEANPAAFERMLRLLSEHDMFRFAATIRAACVWIGFPADVTDTEKVVARVEQLTTMFGDSAVAERAALSGEGWETYLGLCALALHDVDHALSCVTTVRSGSSVAARAAAVKFWQTAGLMAPPDDLAEMVSDPDIRVAMDALVRFSDSLKSLGPERFGVLERLVDRLPEKAKTVPAPGIDGADITLSRSVALGAILSAFQEVPLAQLLRWLSWMDADERHRVAMRASKMPGSSAEVRQVLLTLAGDRSDRVRRFAIPAIARMKVTEAEAPQLEQLLASTSQKIRASVLPLLADQVQPAVVRSGERLWGSGNALQRDAACELLASCDRSSTEVLDAIQRISEQQLTERQRDILGVSIPGQAASVLSAQIDAGLGLFDPTQRAPIPAPKRRLTIAPSDVARAFAIVDSLDELVEAHRDVPIVFGSWQGSREVLLADVPYLPSPFVLSADSDEENSPVLASVFVEWWEHRPAELRGGSEGLDALRAYAAVGVVDHWNLRYGSSDRDAWSGRIIEEVIGGPVAKPRHPIVVSHVLSWMVARNVDTDVVDTALDCMESLFALIPETRLADLPRQGSPKPALGHGTDWRWDFLRQQVWGDVLRRLLSESPFLFTQARLTRLFGLRRWIDEPGPGIERSSCADAPTLQAHAAGIATDHDIYDAMFLESPDFFQSFTTRRRVRLNAKYPAATVLVDALRDRVVEIETGRGDMPTPASPLAVRLASVEGASVAFELLSRLGRAALVTGPITTTARNEVFSHLLRVSYPAPTDSVPAMRALAKELHIEDQSLVDLAVFAPQWADTIEQLLGWDGLADGVWWYHAHAKDDRWRPSAEVRDTWIALSAERTPVSSEDLIAGVVDVDWFERVHARLGAKRWAKLHKSAKVTSGGDGVRRAQLYASAMLGDLDEPALIDKIESKRHQDSVRAVGLLPLSNDPKERKAAVASRYQRLQEFKRESRRFGPQRRASEAAAVEVAIENLARNARYENVQRFIWAMEAAQTEGFADGPVTVVEGDLVVTLSIGTDGEPQLAVRRGEKSLAAIPAKMRNAPAIAELTDLKAEISQQASRVRASLESAMVNQEPFEPSDLIALSRHPVVGPSLKLLVLVDEAGRTMWRAGGAFHTATDESVTPVGVLRIAHPVDLAAADWVAWQERLFVRSVKQPFKQVFRELYTATEAECSGEPLSERWEGHQVQPRRASALFGARGWHVEYSAGQVWKPFHSHGIIANLTHTSWFGTADEVEVPTIESVCFVTREKHLLLPIDQVPSVVFSEAMRDVDLVVSVAHAGGVDPEASASTMEMRETLVRETARLMKLDNVRMVGHHVIIEGVLGEYSVHLGSATVHRRPGGAVCIIPVAAQRRGRLFLPFADDDPKSAELLSKVLLLSKDSTIQDPSILEQLRS